MHRAGADRTPRTSLRRIRPGRRMDKYAAARGTAASRPPGSESAGARQLDELRETPGLGASHRCSERRDPIISTPFIVELRRGTIPRLDQEALLEHPLNGAIQRSRTEPQLAVRACGDVLNDRVAMAVLIGDGHENVKRRGRQRKQRS